MEYYYTNSNQDQSYPYSNKPYHNDRHNNYHNYYYYNSSSYDHEYSYDNNYSQSISQQSEVWKDSNVKVIPLQRLGSTYDHDQYGGYYNNESPIRYDQNTQYQYSNPYEHFPAQSLVVYQYSNSYEHPLDELPAKKGSNFLDPVSTTGFVISYSNTDPKPDLELELAEFDLRNYRGGYSIEDTYGKPLPPSDDICYPPSKLDPTPPPPPSMVREGGMNNVSKTLGLKEEEENRASEDDEDEEDDEEDEEDDEEEEEEEEEENHGVLIVPSLLGEDDQGVNEAEDEEEDEEDDEEEEENRGVMIVAPLPRNDDQGVNEAEEEDEEDEEEESSNSEGYEESEEEQESSKSDDGRVEEKETKRQMIPPGYGLEAMDLCEGVFGGYFPCMRKRSIQGSNNTISSSGNNQDFSSDCWNTTVDYLFGDPDPYARAFPDPIYGYHRYYPQQPISGQFSYGEDHSLMDNSSYYNYEYNGGGY